MAASREDLARFAQEHLAYVALGPDETRVHDPRFVLVSTPGRHFWSAMIGRVRFDGDVDTPLAAARSLLRARGHEAAAWVVAASATPGDVVRRLTDRGLEHAGTSQALLLTRPPDGSGARGLEVRAVRTLDDHIASIEVSADGFGWPAEDRHDELDRAESSFRAEREGDHTTRLLALDDGRPVATGRLWAAPLGLYVGGCATLPSDRGRGAMTSLLVAAWRDAERRGTRAVVAYGGAMSLPVFARLGFETVGEVTHLADRVLA